MELTAFVAAPAVGAAPGQAASRPALRGVPPAEPPAHGSAAGLLMPLGAACACAGLALKRRSQRGSTAQRRFFGGESVPAPAKATSYKDYNDQWLGGADLGFDPLNLAIGTGTFDKAPSAVPQTTYYNYRESEVKHGRFAMTAFLAIFFEEADRGAVARQLGLPGAVDNLDGTLGLDEVQLPVLLIGLGAQALAEYNLQRKEDDGNILSVEYNPDRCPGDLGFDPLNFLKGSGSTKKDLHNIEVNLGRLAMIGATSFLLREFALKG